MSRGKRIADMCISEKFHHTEPIQVFDNFTGECSYKYLGSDVEEQTDYEGSSDDFVPCSDPDSDTSFNSSSDGENKTKSKKYCQN
ncbi:hypothetical protein JTB14_016814 [Gonioctena quinquepunctata]|nr:hypothetical protein JTB14_016814 [Gonioctena quinquepunctata]